MKPIRIWIVSLVTSWMSVCGILDAQVFPLQVSGGGRHLEDRNGRPYFLHGDSPWSLIAQLSKEDAERYLERSHKLGFNAIIVNLLEHAYSDNAPRNHEGAAPFKTPDDFSTPNEAYFAHADWVLNKAQEKGLLVLLFPTWSAAAKAKGGWNREILDNGPEKCRAFGRYLGKRYQDVPNIIWGHGGDQNPASDTDAARNMLELALGIRDAAPKQMHFYHGMRGKTSLDQENFAPHADLDAVYVADEARGQDRVGESHTTSLKAWNREKFKPHFLFEGVYESVRKEKPKWGNPYTSDRARLRRQAYWNILSGSTGHFFGNFPAWTLADGWDGPDGLGSPGYQDMQRLKTLIDAHDWWKLVPDDKHLTVTQGYGTFTEADYVTAARADDGSFVLAYLPSTGTQSRTLTVAGSRLRGPVTARWFNPADGTYKSIGDAPLPNTGSHELTSPGDNGTGSNDWVLVLKAEAKERPRKEGAAPLPKTPAKLNAPTHPVSAVPNSERFADLRVGDWSLDSSGGFAVVADEPRQKIHFLFGTKERLDYSNSSDGGKTWSAAVPVASSNKMPALAVDRQERVHVAYATNNHELHYRSFSAGTWGDPVDLTAGIDGGRVTTISPRLAIDGHDNVHLLYWTVWRSGDPNWRQGSRAVYCYKRAGSDRFDEPQLWANQPTTPGGYGKHGALCTDAQGNMHLFYLTSDQAVANGKITSAIERRIRRPDGTWEPQHDVWPVKDDFCDWSLAATLDRSNGVHLSGHRRVSREGAEIVYLHNRAERGTLAEVHNFGFEPWESWTDLLVEPAGDVLLATAHYPDSKSDSKPDAIGPRGGYYRYDAKAGQWTARTPLPAKDGANLDNRNYSHPRLIRFNEQVHLFYARKEDGVFRHSMRRFDSSNE